MSWDKKELLEEQQMKRSPQQYSIELCGNICPPGQLKSRDSE